MSAPTCSWETAVVAAVRSGEWSEHLEAHVAGCAACSESARVADWLRGVATELTEAQQVPDPTYLWLKAEIARRARDATIASLRSGGILAVVSVAVGWLVAAAVLTVLPQASATVGAVRDALFGAVAAQFAPAELTAIGAVWFGLLLLLAAMYLFVYRPLR